METFRCRLDRDREGGAARASRSSGAYPPQRDRRGELLSFLEREVWSQVPREALGRPLSRVQREEILGYGPDGV
jgi:hypothetical protein